MFQLHNALISSVAGGSGFQDFLETNQEGAKFGDDNDSPFEPIPGRSETRDDIRCLLRVAVIEDVWNKLSYFVLFLYVGVPCIVPSSNDSAFNETFESKIDRKMI